MILFYYLVPINSHLKFIKKIILFIEIVYILVDFNDYLLLSASSCFTPVIVPLRFILFWVSFRSSM